MALQSSSMGSVQVLPNGNIFVGWGAEPYVSEFTPDGTLKFTIKIASAEAILETLRDLLEELQNQEATVL